jgi:hypothetical protein
MRGNAPHMKDIDEEESFHYKDGQEFGYYERNDEAG